VKLRLFSIAFLLSCLATGLAWLSLNPALLRLLSATRSVPSAHSLAEGVRRALPLHLALDLVLATVLAYLLLRFAFESLTREQALTRRQLDELQESHARVSKAQTELVAAERLATVGKLAAGVAHEVGNPLSGILGYLSLARSSLDKTDGARTREYLELIDHEVQRIDAIVRGLLDLGRPAKGQAVPVQVAQLVETCVQLLRAGSDFAHVVVRVEVPPPAVVLAEPGPLSQVLINLLLNAAQAQGGKGSVMLSGQMEGDHFRLLVEDAGPGLSAEVMDHLFEPFFTTKSAGKGTGLGLSVSRHLLERMGGHLSAGNAPGGGARFTVTLRSPNAGLSQARSG
jgi:signal transduction histidine kinase